MFKEAAENAYDFGPDLADVTAEFLAETRAFQTVHRWPDHGERVTFSGFCAPFGVAEGAAAAQRPYAVFCRAFQSRIAQTQRHASARHEGHHQCGPKAVIAQ